MSRWRRSGAAVHLADGDRFRSASQDEVIGALDDEEESARLREQLPGVRFSRVALSPRVVLEGQLPDTIIARLAVLKRREFHDVEPGADQVIITQAWHPLLSQEMAACLDLLRSHRVSPGDRVPLGRYLAINADPAAAALLENLVADPEELPNQLANDAWQQPEGVQADLFPYQIKGSAFLSAMAEREVGTLLADEMGLGKTLQAITLLVEQSRNGPALVVAPASLLMNWRRELAQFAPALRTQIHAGPQRTGLASGLRGFDVVVTSYETVVIDLSFLGEIPWNVVVLDEAQNIRNPEAQRAVAVKSLPRRVPLAVTGTPVENKLTDLFSIAEFVVPSLLGTREEFERIYPDAYDCARALGHVVGPITIRRLVSDVAKDLPPLLVEQVALSLAEPDRRDYEEVERTSANPLAAQTRLRVLCAHAQSSQEQADAEARALASPKFDYVRNALTEVFGRRQKALIFTSFTESLQRLRAMCDETFPRAAVGVVDGSVPALERQRIIDGFSDFEGAGCLILNTRAGGTGLNITAANHVIHFNPEWNPALTRQATARAHRRRQELPVTAHYLYYEGTVEQRVVESAEFKKMLAQGLDEGTVSGAAEGGEGSDGV